DPKTGRREPNREQEKRRPEQVHRGDDERTPAKRGISEERDGDLAREAEPRVQSGLACKPDGRLLDREIAHVERVTDRAKSDDQQPVRRPGTGKKQLHAASMGLQCRSDQRAICSPSNLTARQGGCAALKTEQRPVGAGVLGGGVGGAQRRGAAGLWGGGPPRSRYPALPCLRSDVASGCKLLRSGPKLAFTAIQRCCTPSSVGAPPRSRPNSVVLAAASGPAAACAADARPGGKGTEAVMMGSVLTSRVAAGLPFALDGAVFCGVCDAGGPVRAARAAAVAAACFLMAPVMSSTPLSSSATRPARRSRSAAKARICSESI